MVRLEFDIPDYMGGQPLLAGLEAVQARIARSLAEAHVKAVEEEAKTKAPARTGRLRGSIRAYFAGMRSGVLLAEAPHAKYLHEGTGVHGPGGKPYRVKPKRKLALFWSGAAHPVRAVWHRGIPQRDFLRLALRQHFASIWLDAARANAELQAQVDAAYARMLNNGDNDAPHAQTANGEGGGAKAAPVGLHAQEEATRGTRHLCGRSVWIPLAAIRRTMRILPGWSARVATNRYILIPAKHLSTPQN